MTRRLRKVHRFVLARHHWPLCPSQRGQSLVEMALFLPLIAFFGLACVQFAVLFVVYINVINTTRDAARYIGVHPHVIDSTNLALVRGRLPGSLQSASLTMTVTPACAALTSGKCAGRTTGSQISVASTYNIASHLFLPSTFGYGRFVFQVPTSLPTYSIFMQVEPA